MKYGETPVPATIKSDDDVTPTTGKYAGKRGYVMYETYAHPLNPTERMFSVRVQTGTSRGWVTLRVQEKNLKKLK
ncbi:hypothetical protein [Acinetobacter phage ABPH49]|nr:hypothetical protein [Acinetobacter phage ABPH49]